MNIKSIETEIIRSKRTVKTTILFLDGSIHKTYLKIPLLVWLLSDKETLITIYHMFDCIEWGHTEVESL